MASPKKSKIPRGYASDGRGLVKQKTDKQLDKEYFWKQQRAQYKKPTMKVMSKTSSDSRAAELREQRDARSTQIADKGAQTTQERKAVREEVYHPRPK